MPTEITHQCNQILFQTIKIQCSNKKLAQITFFLHICFNPETILIGRKTILLSFFLLSKMVDGKELA